MAKTYRPYIPEQDLRLPPSLREWLPEDPAAPGRSRGVPRPGAGNAPDVRTIADFRKTRLTPLRGLQARVTDGHPSCCSSDTGKAARVNS